MKESSKLTPSSRLVSAEHLAEVTTQTNHFLKEMDTFIQHSKEADVSTESALLNTSSLSHRSSRSKSRERSERSRSRSRSRGRESPTDRSNSRHRSSKREERSSSKKKSPKVKVHFEEYGGEVYQYSPVVHSSHPYKTPLSPRSSMHFNARDSLLLPKYESYRIPVHSEEIIEDRSKNVYRNAQTSPHRKSSKHSDDAYLDIHQATPIKPLQPMYEMDQNDFNQEYQPTTPARRVNQTLHVEELLSSNFDQSRSKKSPARSPAEHRSSSYRRSRSHDPSYDVPSPQFHLNSPLRLSPPNSGFQEQCDLIKQRIRRLIEINNSLSNSFQNTNDSIQLMSPNLRGISKIEQPDSPNSQRTLHDIR